MSGGGAAQHTRVAVPRRSAAVLLSGPAMQLLSGPASTWSSAGRCRDQLSPPPPTPWLPVAQRASSKSWSAKTCAAAARSGPSARSLLIPAVWGGALQCWWPRHAPMGSSSESCCCPACARRSSARLVTRPHQPSSPLSAEGLPRVNARLQPLSLLTAPKVNTSSWKVVFKYGRVERLCQPARLTCCCCCDAARGLGE